jgi:hypothetical protein
VEDLLVKDDEAVVELHSLATAKNGMRFDSRYCWVVYFRGIDRASSCLPRLSVGRPIVRRESDCLIGCNGLPFLPPPILIRRNGGVRD